MNIVFGTFWATLTLINLNTMRIEADQMDLYQEAQNGTN